MASEGKYMVGIYDSKTNKSPEGFSDFVKDFGGVVSRLIRYSERYPEAFKEISSLSSRIPTGLNFDEEEALRGLQRLVLKSHRLE